VRSNHRTVDDQIFQVRFRTEMLVHSLPDATVAPAGEAFVDGVPVAILGRQQSPLRSGAIHPQHALDKPLAFRRVANVHVRAIPQELQNLRPLV
jgi:hypothetical protein